MCSRDFAIYFSWMRHLANEHSSTPVQTIFECLECHLEFPSKRSSANHQRSAHPGLRTSRWSLSAGDFKCTYCNDHFPNKVSQSQHIHNQHMEQASEDWDREKAITGPRYWTKADHTSFLDALARFGPSLNIALAREIGTKDAKQVVNHKRIFLRDNPDWISRARATPPSPPSLVTQPTADKMSPQLLLAIRPRSGSTRPTVRKLLAVC